MCLKCINIIIVKCANSSGDDPALLRTDLIWTIGQPDSQLLQFILVASPSKSCDHINIQVVD